MFTHTKSIMNTQKANTSLIGKILLLSFLFLFVGTTQIFAQSARGRQMRNKNATAEGKAEKRSQQWQTKFGLNNLQTYQLEVAMLKQNRDMETLKGGGNGFEKKEKRQAIKTEFEAKVRNIFTPTQYASYQKMKAEKKEKNKNKGKRKYKNKGKNKNKKIDDYDNDNF